MFLCRSSLAFWKYKPWAGPQLCPKGLLDGSGLRINFGGIFGDFALLTTVFRVCGSLTDADFRTGAWSLGRVPGCHWVTFSDSASDTDGAPGVKAEAAIAPRPQGGSKWSVVRGAHGSDGGWGWRSKRSQAEPRSRVRSRRYWVAKVRA